MPLASNLKYHELTFDFATPPGRWRWTTRLDVSLSAPSYSIRDVVTPYGLYRDSIPIPGDVVAAMAASIDELRVNFPPHILLGPPTSLTFIVDEGRGFSTAQDVTLTNDGVYSSLLSTVLTTSAPYVRVTPGAVGNLANNESGHFMVDVNSATLLASSSPYSASVTMTDATATNSPQSLPVTITVRPKATISASPLILTFTVAKPLSGSFPSIATQTFDVTNSGPSGSVLEYAIKKLTGLSDWLTSFLPAAGTLTSGDSDTVVVTVVPPDNMVQGTYSETLRICGYSTNSHLDVEIHLVIT